MFEKNLQNFKYEKRNPDYLKKGTRKTESCAYIYNTAIGKLTIVDNGKAITNVYFGEYQEDNVEIKETVNIKKAINEINEYLDGKRKNFTVRIDPCGSDFQKKVWEALLKIPYGKTNCYKEIAAAIGNEKASRAVGMANNKNPIPIIIPCHRVIGSNGKLVGYAGGLDIKTKLLNIEK